MNDIRTPKLLRLKSNSNIKVFVFTISLLVGTALSINAQPTLHIPASHICQLPSAPFNGYIAIPPDVKVPEDVSRLPATINVNFVTGGGCNTWPTDAQTAMTYAANLWAAVLNSTTPINIDACWNPSLGGNTLGSAGAAFYLGLNVGGNISWYPVALAEHLLVDPNQASVEINANFNANRTDWYFGTDMNVAFNQIDFVTVALHEIGHGLGFAGVNGIDDGAGGAECDGVAGEGCLGFENAGSFIPDIYSRQVEKSDGNAVLDEANPSVAIANLLTGNNGGLFAGSANVVSSNGSDARLYTPSTYAGGSTYSHWDLATFPSELMKPSLPSGAAIHSPGLAASLLADIGWSLSILPVELIAFDLRATPEAINLIWSTESEVNNAGFEIQRSKDAIHWDMLGFVEGKGEAASYSYTDYAPNRGLNYYRLVQTDYDGTIEYSDAKAIYFNEEVASIGLYPNPASHELLVGAPGLDVMEPVFIYDSFGKRVLENTMTEPRSSISIEALPEGMYWLKLGERKAVPFLKQRE